MEFFVHLTVGQEAPGFNLPDAGMEYVELENFRHKNNVVLFFYPKDGTPYCTEEATDFSDHEEAFAEHGCVLLGVSRDDCLRHAEFCDRAGIGIRLLSDASGEVCRQYCVWHPKVVDGVKKYAVSRSTFVIDKQGVIRHALYDVNYKGHALDVLELVKALDA